MGKEDDISYAGPSHDYQPIVGGTRPDVKFNFYSPSERSYADIALLRKQLEDLNRYITAFTNRLENDLSKWAMVVSPADLKLTSAVANEWPKELGTPEPLVSYRYYKVLKGRSTTTSDYITQKFEEASRDIAGSDAVDILAVVASISEESKLVSEFLDTFVNDVDDPAEFRILELFQDWASNALVHAGNLGSLYTQSQQGYVDDAELDKIGPAAARDAQAVLKVKINDLTAKWAKDFESYSRNFSTYAPTFYGRFLGPALRFRLNVSRKFLPSEGVLGGQVSATVEAVHASLEQTITDQMRRNSLFDEKMNSLTKLIYTRSIDRSTINKLSTIGTSISSTISGAFIPFEESADAIAVFDSLVQENINSSSATPSTRSAHSLLTGLDDPNAHSQYLLKSGGEISGNVTLSDGVTIDGVIPHTHAHTGSDGSSKIKGSDISGGTLGPDLIDTAQKPSAPTGLILKNSSVRIVPPGVSVIDAEVSWVAESGLQFEVQVAVIS